METVTVPKEYFHILMRRAKLHVTYENNDNDAAAAATHLPSHVSIPREEHEALLQSRQEYDYLRTALLNGGLSPEKLNILAAGLPSQPVPVNSRSNWQDNARTTRRPPVRSDWSTNAPVFVPQAHRNPFVGINRSYNISHNESVFPSPGVYNYEDEETSVTSEANVAPVTHVHEQQSRAINKSFGQRTLAMRGLPNGTTLLDVVKSIRGGQLLNVVLRSWERSQEMVAHVSFVEAASAAAFLSYFKQASILILGKRVDLFYNDRQYQLPGHIGYKMSTYGATRNLVIHHAKPDVTSQSIRDDLEHIHQLEVVEIKVIGDEVYISLNSIHNAVTARSCMQSRLKYKGYRIDYYPDECDQPLPEVPRRAVRKFDPLQAEASNPRSSNRFQMLANDDEYGGNDDNEGKDEEIQQPHGLDRRVPALSLASWRRAA